MEEQEARRWAPAASGNQNAEHEIYAGDSVCDYP
jgi:hypothetical protein